MAERPHQVLPVIDAIATLRSTLKIIHDLTALAVDALDNVTEEIISNSGPPPPAEGGDDQDHALCNQRVAALVMRSTRLRRMLLSVALDE